MIITIYDGADTIGGTKIHIEENNGLFLDFGMNFARYIPFIMKSILVRELQEESTTYGCST